MPEDQQAGAGRKNLQQKQTRLLRQEAAGRKTEPCMNVRSATGRNWMIRLWSSGTVPSVMGIMNIVRIIYLPTST